MRHVALAAAGLITYGLIVVLGNDDLDDALSLSTAWLCFAYMAAALSLGPIRARRTGKPVTNLQARRDLGIWAGITGLVHLWVATDQSMTERYMAIYVNIADQVISASARADLFAWGSIIGFLIGLVLLLLLGLSNNWILNKLGVKTWKRMQRLAYPAFALTAAHGVMFQLLESRQLYWVALLILVAAGVALLQVLGVRAVRSGDR